jgi:hypothetical protein
MYNVLSTYLHAYVHIPYLHTRVPNVFLTIYTYHIPTYIYLPTYIHAHAASMQDCNKHIFMCTIHTHTHTCMQTCITAYIHVSRTYIHMYGNTYTHR